VRVALARREFRHHFRRRRRRPRGIGSCKSPRQWLLTGNWRDELERQELAVLSQIIDGRRSTRSRRSAP